ncbi:MAG: hypothetical protein IJ170_08845 [Ruminococcus sp.]|nr:hypothetical protein [Ruminococcus sp.]
MRKLLALITALAACGALFSCGQDPAESDDPEETTEAVTEEITEEETEEETAEPDEPEERTVGISFDLPPLVSAALHGVFGSDVYIKENTDEIHRNYVGQFGTPVEIGGELLEESILRFEYDPDNMGDVPPGNLSVIFYNEKESRYDTIKRIRLDEEKHTVSAKITEPGTYFLFDTGEKAHTTVFEDDEYKFRIAIPEEIELRYVSSYLEDDEEGKFKVLLECEKNDQIQVGIEYLERPGYSNTVEMVDAICETLDSQETLYQMGNVTGADGSTGYYFVVDFSEGDDKAYSINCFYPLNDTECINIWYGFKDLELLDKAMASLESFEFTGHYSKPQDPAVKKQNETCPINANSVTFELPVGVTMAPGDGSATPSTDDPDHLISQIYEDCRINGYDGLRNIFIEGEKNGIAPATEADAYRKSIDGVNGIKCVRSDEVELSNGKKGYILQIETEGDDQLEPTCYINGYFETNLASWTVRVTVIADADMDQAKKDELYKVVCGVDVDV